MAEPRITFTDVGKRYGKLWALRELNVAFHPGEVVMIIGPTGSGKTTLIKCLLGLVRPKTGSIAVNVEVFGTDEDVLRTIDEIRQSNRADLLSRLDDDGEGWPTDDDYPEVSPPAPNELIAA